MPPDAPASASTTQGSVGGRLAGLLQRNVLVVLGLTAGVTVHAALLRREIASDSWYSLVSGRIVSRSGIPHHDTLAVLTHGREWIDQQWLAHLALYGLWSAGGWPLVLLGDLLLYLAAFVVTAIAARLLGASERAVALAVMAGYALGADNTVLRAQIAAYVLFALVLLLCLRDERRPSGRVFLVLPVLALWANVHGSVVLGAGLVALRGVTFAGGGLRARAPMRTWLPRGGALILLPWLCTLASPYGIALPRYYHSVLGNSSFAYVVTEWAASTVRNDPYFFALLLPGLWLVARGRSALPPFAQLAFLGTAVAGLLAVRNVVWFALVAAATLPAALDDLWPPSESPRRARVNFSLMAAGAVAAVGAASVTLAHGRSWFEHSYPQAASAAVASATRADPSADVFATERYADWLLFENPSLAGRIAYDIRFELLSSPDLAALVAFRSESGPDWQRATRGYRVLVLDPAEDGGAIALFERQPGTVVLFHDRNVVVLRRAATPAP